MRIISFIMAITIAPSLQLAHAATDEHKKAAEELLILTKATEQVSQALEFQKQYLLKNAKETNVPPEAKQLHMKLIEDEIGMLSEAMSWESMKDLYIKGYTENLSIEEIKQIIEFYRSQAGQKYMTQRPYISQAMMNAGLIKIQSIQPAFAEREKQYYEDLKKLTSHP